MMRTWQWEAVAAVARHPALWGSALTQARRMARPAWWRQRPWLPLPDPDYVAFRLSTAYGDGGRPAPGEVLAYLRWCRDFRK